MSMKQQTKVSNINIIEIVNKALSSNKDDFYVYMEKEILNFPKDRLKVYEDDLMKFCRTNKTLSDYLDRILNSINTDLQTFDTVPYTLKLSKKQVDVLSIHVVERIIDDMYTYKRTSDKIEVDDDLIYSLWRSVCDIKYHNKQYSTIFKDLENYALIDLSKYTGINESGNIYYTDKMPYYKDWDISKHKAINEYRESYVFPCGHFEESHNTHNCLKCAIITGKSQARTMSNQDMIVDLFKVGITNKCSSSGNYESSGNYILHYNTVEAMRLNDGTLVSNSQCWSAGFAVCSFSGGDYSLPLSTLINAFGQHNIENMHILDNKKNSSDTLLLIDNRYILYGVDNQDHSEFLAECPIRVKTVKEALNSLNPLNEYKPNMYTRQGDLFFLHTDKEFDVYDKQHFIKLEKQLSWEQKRELGKILKSKIDTIYPNLLNYTKFEYKYERDENTWDYKRDDKGNYIIKSKEVYNGSFTDIDDIARFVVKIKEGNLMSFDKAKYISGGCEDNIVTLNEADNKKLIDVYTNTIQEYFDGIKAPKELVRCKIFNTNHEAQFLHEENKNIDGTSTVYVKGYIYHTNGSHHKYHLDKWSQVFRNKAKQTWQVTRSGRGGGD